MNQKLKFDKPASKWLEAMPLGNGSLGAMIFGGVDTDLIQFNQESVWSAPFRDRINKDSYSHLTEIRDLVFSGELEKAEQSVYMHMLSEPVSMGHYEPLVDLKIVHDTKIEHYSKMFTQKNIEYENYVRQLSFKDSIYSNSYIKDGIEYKKECFISYPDQVMAYRIQTNQPVSIRVELSRQEYFDSIQTSDETIILAGKTSGCEFICGLKVECDGIRQKIGNYIQCINCKDIILYLTGRTDFYEDNPFMWTLSKLERAMVKGYELLKEFHIKDYQKLYMKSSLSLHDEKIEQYYNFGKYLLISSSRKYSLPMNLQGIWNQDFHPSWGSRYTTNINLEMNYWPCSVMNLEECMEPLFTHLKRMLPNAKKVAKEMYGCRGAVCHHNTDIYGDCAPQGNWMPASIWPTGYAWLCFQVIEQYRFNQDVDFIKEYYDVIQEASIFFLDYLCKKDGCLVTCPSTSPENTYILENGQMSTICFGPTMDSQIIRELWKGFIEISNDLHIENKDIIEIKNQINFLPKEEIGSFGQILEWTKEYNEWEKGHRHISHLFGLYPGNTISMDLYSNAKITLEERLKYGGGQTGWSMGWIINMWARLHEGQKAYDGICTLLKENTADNLFDLHPPVKKGMSSVFQIDGNMGACAGIQEMLIQSHQDYIELLPALPEKWKDGFIHNFKVRNNIEIDMVWKDKEIVSLSFYSNEIKEINVKIQDEIIKMKTEMRI